MCSDLALDFSLPTPNSELFPPFRKDCTQGDERGRLVCTLDGTDRLTQACAQGGCVGGTDGRRQERYIHVPNTVEDDGWLCRDHIL